jgi:hypothetical protein
MASLRNEVCFAGPSGPVIPGDVVKLLTKVQARLKERSIAVALDGGNVELTIENKPATLRLISWEAPNHCSLQLFDEPLENEDLTDSPVSRAVLESLHKVLLEAGYDPEWIGPDEDVGDEPFGQK